MAAPEETYSPPSPPSPPSPLLSPFPCPLSPPSQFIHSCPSSRPPPPLLPPYSRHQASTTHRPNCTYKGLKMQGDPKVKNVTRGRWNYGDPQVARTLPHSSFPPLSLCLSPCFFCSPGPSEWRLHTRLLQGLHSSLLQGHMRSAVLQGGESALGPGCSCCPPLLGATPRRGHAPEREFETFSQIRCAWRPGEEKEEEVDVCWNSAERGSQVGRGDGEAQKEDGGERTANVELRAGCENTRGLTHHRRRGAQECGPQLAPSGRSRSYPRCKYRRTLDDNTGRRPCALQRARQRDGGAAGWVPRGRTNVRRTNHTHVTSPSDIRISNTLLCTETCTYQDHRKPFVAQYP